MILAVLRNPRVIIGIAIAIALVLLLSVVPATENWGASNDARVNDLDVESRVEWGGGLDRRWSIETLDVVDTYDSRVINLGATLRNALFLGDFLDSLSSDSHDVRFTLEQGGRVVMEETERTGSGSAFGTEKIIKLTFRKVPLGGYTLRATIMDDGGNALASLARSIIVVPEDN